MRKTLILAAALAAGCIGAAQAETPAASGAEDTPNLCTNDPAKVDARHVYSAECPSVSAVRQPDGSWVPAKDMQDMQSPPAGEGTDEPETPSPTPAAPDMGSGNNY
jgi:hypothetical protein